MDETKEKRPSGGEPFNAAIWESCGRSGAGSTSDDNETSRTIQQIVLEFFSGVFDATGEAAAKELNWEISFTAMDIAEAMGLGQRQVANAIYRLKHRRHTLWYKATAGGKVYHFTIPEIFFMRGPGRDKT